MTGSDIIEEILINSHSLGIQSEVMGYAQTIMLEYPKMAKDDVGTLKLLAERRVIIEKHIKDMHTEEKKPKNCGCGQDPCITYGKKEMKKESIYSDWKNEKLVLEVMPAPDYFGKLDVTLDIGKYFLLAGSPDLG